jgi:hypothetical protein
MTRILITYQSANTILFLNKTLLQGFNKGKASGIDLVLRGKK